MQIDYTPKIHAPGIITLKFECEDLCDELAEKLLKTDRWEQAKIFNVKDGDLDESKRKSYYFTLDGLKEFESELTAVKNVLEQSCDVYSNIYNISLNEIESLQALRYKKGGFYSEHFDAYSYRRRVSALLYLNDNFTGGSTYFPGQRIEITPEKGKILLFSCSHAYLHEGLTVKSGTKYAIYTFLCDNRER